MPLTPKNRKEEWIQGLVDHETTLTPKNRPEEWMKEIINASGSGGGTGGGALIVHASGEPLTLDKTWKEISDAASAGNNVMLSLNGGTFNLVEIAPMPDEGYYVMFGTSLEFSASSQTDYPSTNQ